MTAIIKTNRSFESRPTQPLQEVTITIIPIDVLKSILVLANQSETALLVSRHWNDLTFTAVKEISQDVLKKSIPLITEKLNPVEHAQCIADLSEIQDAHQSLTVATCAEDRRLFLISKGFVIGALRKLPGGERGQLRKAIGDELPDSMKDIFEISYLSLFRILKSVDLDTFFTLLQSYQPLSIEDRGSVFVSSPAETYNIEFVKVLLANGPISEKDRGEAVWQAAKRNNIEFVKVLLANGPISDDDRGLAFQLACQKNNIEIVRLLLANGEISEMYRDMAIGCATRHNNPELIQLLEEPSIMDKIISGIAGMVASVWPAKHTTIEL